MRLILCTVFLGLSLITPGHCQPGMLHLTIDNDSFLFSQTDWYYTSGIYASYRRVIEQENALINPASNKEHKVIRVLGLSHQVYTPRLFNSPLVDQYDRPHAAIIQFHYGLSFAREKSIVQFDGSIGWMGPALGTGPVLEWLHDVFGYRTPRGWDYEISNTPVIQLNSGWTKTIIAKRYMDINLVTKGHFGTVFIDATAGLEGRIGRILAIKHSILFDQFTSADSTKKLIELFANFGAHYRYSFYNATIEGGIINDTSPHIETPENWVHNVHFGIGLGGNRFDTMITLNYRSPTTTKASRHKFVTLKMNYRL